VRGNKLRTALVVAEVALSLVLLIGAGLLWRSFAEIRRVEPGFDAANVVTFTAPVQFTTYYTAGLRANFYDDLARRISELPGVERVGGSAPLPLAGGELYSVGSYGRPGDPENTYQANKADYKAVIPGFFEALEIDLVAGRTFLTSDNQADAQRVAIVDEKLAERVFGNESPLGKELLVDHFSEETFSMERASVVVVGVAANIRSSSLAEEGRETIYVPYIFSSFLPLTYVVRTRTDPSELAAAVRAEVVAMDPDVPVSSVSTLATYVSNSMAPARFMLALIGVFATVALVLASLGLYGVISYSVRQRTREFGVRIAFGAGDGDVVGLVVRQGMLVTAAGIVIGLGASFALRRIVDSLLVGVSPTDPLTYAGVPALLLAISVVACYVPARRATAVDPVEALRDE
jgi:putative ABC transport system permease protein